MISGGNKMVGYFKPGLKLEVVVQSAAEVIQQFDEPRGLTLLCGWHEV